MNRSVEKDLSETGQVPDPPSRSPLPVTVQVASLNTKKAAEKVGHDLAKRLRGTPRIAILKQGNFYKTRIAGFKSREEAQTVLDGIGVREYFSVIAHAQ